MNRYVHACLCRLAAVILVAGGTPLWAREWYVAPDGQPQGRGTRQSPWDLESALATQPRVGPGDTIWLAGGIYKHPDRRTESSGYKVRLRGIPLKPIHVRPLPGQRVTIDGGLSILPPSNWLWIWDLEIIVSENSFMPRRLDEPGSHPASYNRPGGGLNIHTGRGCKYINLVIHDNAQGVGFWNEATDSELYGAIIYDNGWEGPDRRHGHAIYSQNQLGAKTIADCIMTGGYSYSLHAYGSRQAFVDNYLVAGNVCYEAGRFLIGGGRPSRNIRVLNNYLYKVDMQLGYAAPENNDCEVRDNVIVDGKLTIKDFRQVTEEGNLVLGRSDPRPTGESVRIAFRRNRYDPNRANVAIFNWAKQDVVELSPGSFLVEGNTYRLQDPRDFFGPAVLSGVYDGKSIRVPVRGEFAAFVLLKE